MPIHPINSIHEQYFKRELFINDIKTKRTELGLTHYALGKITAMCPTSMSLIEQGKQYPTIESYCRIIRWLEVSADRYIINN